MIFHGAIDAHVHLWDAARNDDILVLKNRPELAETARSDLLAAHLQRIGVSGAILVQSAPTTVHSDWLRATGRHIKGVIGIVGWLDVLATDPRPEMDDLISDPLVCGIRIMLNRMENPISLINPSTLALIAEVADSGLAIECLSPPTHLDIVARLAAELGHAQFVVDHCGLPPATSGFPDWKAAMASLAKLSNVTTKFSGLTEPFGPEVNFSDVSDQAQWVLDLFGPSRLMAASNFPVCDLGGGVERWGEFLADILNSAGLAPDERQMILRNTASRVFGRVQSR